MGRPGLKVCASAKELAEAAAGLFIESMREALGSRGVFTAVLSGGRTPLGLYEALASRPLPEGLGWAGAHLFWGDERCVGPESAESNFNAAWQSLLSRIDIPPGNIHRMRGELDPMDAASIYEKELASFFSLPSGVPPLFDLVLLGMGADGHTLSLFPSGEALGEGGRLVTAARAGKAGAWRVTMTLRAISRARRRLFLVSGRDKAAVLKDVMEGKGAHPAAMVTGPGVGWLVDSEAASLMEGG